VEIWWAASKVFGFVRSRAAWAAEWTATRQLGVSVTINGYSSTDRPSSSVRMIVWLTPNGGLYTTLNTAYTVGSSILWVHTFVYHIFILFNYFHPY
jgi:hypothetical protein